MSALWRFSIDPDRASEGWLDPSAGGFRSKPISSLAREIIQNSLDAKNENDPLVRVTFKAHEVETSKLPDISSLRHAISRCVNSEQIHSNHNIDLMRIAKNTIYQDRIKVLSIKEEGTKGMEGPCEPGKDVYNYMKVVAISGKSSNEGNRGSHGIGKAAPLVCSKINTIFASTKYAGNAEQILGRASLCSHFDDEGAIRKGTGYWGKDGEPVEYDQLFPEWLNRKSPGTDIHILGFREPDYWVTTLLGSIIKNFFVVICEGKLEVEIELDSQSKVSLKDALELNEEKISPPLPKNYRIDKETIGKYFLSEHIQSDLAKLEDLDLYSFLNANGLYRAYIEADYSHYQEIEGLGKVRFYLKIKSDEKNESESNNYNVGIVRDGMYITNEIKGLKRGTKFKKCRPFDFLIETVDKQGSNFIRSMEPPEHNAIEIEHLPDDPVKKREAEKALKDLADMAVVWIKSKAEIKLEEGTTAADIFDDIFLVEGGDKGISKDYDPTGGFIITPCDPKKRDMSKEADEVVETGEEGGSGTGSGGGGKTVTDGPGEGEGAGGTGDEGNETKKKKGKISLQLKDIRMIPKSGKQKNVHFTCTETTTIFLSVLEMGAELGEQVNVSKACQGKKSLEVIDKKFIEIKVDEGKRCSIEIELVTPSSKAFQFTAEKK